MKNKFPSKLTPIKALSSCAILGASQSCLAAISYVNGDSSIQTTLNDGAFFTGFASGDPTFPSAFSGNFLVQGNEQKTSAAQPLANIPISVAGGSAGFEFYFDSQETNNTRGQPNRERIIFSELTLFYLTAAQFADATPDAGQMLGIWSLTPGDQVHINDTLDPSYVSTAKPLGNGADASLTIPFSVFPTGATSADYIFFRATLTDGDNGPDEWIYSAAPGIVTFNNTPDLDPDLETADGQLIPEPSTTVLLLLAATGACFRRRLC